MYSFIIFAGMAAAHATHHHKHPSRASQNSITPHDFFSSSVGVLGCHINTNRVAYWPSEVSCDNICVKLSYGGRSLHLLKIDRSGGAYDISYDAWNYLVFGKSAKDEPHMGGGVQMTTESVPASECNDLLHNGRLPVSAPNSVNYISNCLQQPNSFVANNYEFINMLDSSCKFGYDEVCTFDPATSNQPQCPHTLGVAHQPTGQKVVNIEYGTGKEVIA
ncbi:hypothetical protein DER45DRAFT_627288 [Fusarium avenaceum]|nr:hypothetical protein DER45DRAFT_627288 [Fusarium avenaceum]